MSQGSKKDEQNVQTPRSDKRDHRGVKKKLGDVWKVAGKLWCSPGRGDTVGES